MADKMIININVPSESKQSLISEIRSLSGVAKRAKPVEPDIDSTATFILSSTKKNKEKKKKKESNHGFMVDDDQPSRSSRFRDEPEENDDFLDVDAMMDIISGDDNDDLADDIINEQKGSYERQRKEENAYRKEFAESTALLYDLLDTTSKFSKDLEKRYKVIEGSKARGMGKTSNDLVISIINSKNTMLSIIKEISGTKKTIHDLTLKAESKNKDAGGAKSNEAVASAYFQQMLGYGRNNFVGQMGLNGGITDDQEMDDVLDGVSHSDPIQLDDDLLEMAINRRLNDEGNQFRSSAGSKLIQYENAGIKVFVRRYIDTGAWDFVALDKDNQIVDDYPLPLKSDAGKMSFNDAGSHATDDMARTYKVIELYSSNMDNDDDE